MSAPFMNPDMIRALVIAELQQGNKPALDLVNLIAKRQRVKADMVRREIRRLLERGEISVGPSLKLTLPGRPQSIDRHVS
jgi:hypothetical protein